MTSRLASALTLFLAGCGMVPSATRAPALAPAAPSAQVADGCVAFDWIRLPGAADARSLIRLPVTIGGKEQQFQLDTGADATFLYADSADVARRGTVERRGNSLWTVADLAVGTHAVGDADIVVYGRREGRVARAAMRLLALPQIDGTLGLDALVGAVTLIDYPAQRVCILNALPPALESATDWAPATLRADRLLLRAAVGDTRLDSLLFDTGSSELPLTVDGDLWRRLTGQTPSADGVERRTVSAWGRDVALAGAPARGALQIGPSRLATPAVWTRVDDPTYHADELTAVGGILGNALFWDGAVVLDLRADAARFGIVPARVSGRKERCGVQPAAPDA